MIRAESGFVNFRRFDNRNNTVEAEWLEDIDIVKLFITSINQTPMVIVTMFVVGMR